MKKSSVLMAAAMTGIISAAVSLTAPTSAFADDAKGMCQGANACKGKGACGGKGHTCAGKNECKGKGVLEMTKAECQKAHGKKFKDSMWEEKKG